MEDLLKQAAVIRDELTEKENTAERVGTLFVDVIQRMQKIVVDEQAKIRSLKVIANASAVKIVFSIIDESGCTINKQLVFPAVSGEKAGLLTAEQLNDLNTRIRGITPHLIKESDFNKLKESGQLDSEKYYYTYDEEI